MECVKMEIFGLHYSRGAYSQFTAQLAQTHTEADKKHHQIQRQINQKKRELHWSNAQVETWLKEQVQNGRIDAEFLEKRKEYIVNFPFQDPPEIRDGSVISLQNVSFNYPGGPTLFNDVNCALWTNSRVCVVGPNGIGKSTLINLCTGALEPVTGVVTLNRQVRIGRYTQHFMDSIPLEKTPVQYLIELGLKDEFEARGLLGSFGLEGVCHHQMCASLSGGQKARVALASISTIVPHFILFDEPTNHLDLESIEALCEAINDFRGGVLVVTHDARLIERTNMNLWIVGDKNVKPFTGTLDDYKQLIREQFAALEEQREQERKKLDEYKKLLKEHGSEEGIQQAMAKKGQAVASSMDDFFASADKKVTQKKEKKEKKDKKDKAGDDADDKNDDDDDSGEKKDKKEKKEKKEKKDKKDK